MKKYGYSSGSSCCEKKKNGNFFVYRLGFSWEIPNDNVLCDNKINLCVF